MKLTRLSFSALVVFTLLSASCNAATTADPGQISMAVGKLLQQHHYARQPLNDEISQKFLETYLKSLDYAKLFFTQEDVDGFKEKYGRTLDEDVMLGSLEPAYAIFDVYFKRVEDRVAKVKELLKDEKFDFNSERKLELDRDKVPWPKNEEEEDAIWRDRVENELLQARIADGKAEGTPKEIVGRRYDRLLRSTHEMDREYVVKVFLNALALTYDPHSEYLSQSDLENFTINMKLSLFGIGAMLRSEDGYAKISELIPGGPAAMSGKLKVNDRISGVAQGDQPFVDVVDMKLDKVVELIRGKKGTTVRLQVIPAAATDPSDRKIVEIVRDEVKLTEQEAKAEIVEHKGADGKAQKLGWVTLPSFYADMEHRTRTSKSTTRDVRALLGRLTKEGIDGLIIDLRRNGGGSLEEAINLTGLFIKEGPVVLAKNAEGRTTTYSDDDPTVAYSGPMVVLISKQSASASEIFAAALQDYGRAVIVGDKSSFGKGTVQTMLEIGRIMSPFGLKLTDAGALKLTIQKFYRVAGGSTQLKGVASDVTLPSRLDSLEIGEVALENPLEYDEVKPEVIEKWTEKIPFLGELRARSGARVGTSKDFSYILEDNARLKEKMDENKISLNETKRREEIDANKKRKEERETERNARKEEVPNTWEITLETVNKPDLKKVSLESEKKKDGEAGEEDEEIEDIDSAAAKPWLDPARVEALNILSDVIELSKRPKTASVTGQKVPTVD